MNSHTVFLSAIIIAILSSGCVIFSEVSNADSDPETFTEGLFTYAVTGAGTVEVESLSESVSSGADIVVPDTVVHDGLSYDVVGIDDFVFEGAEMKTLVLGDKVLSLGYCNVVGCEYLEKVDMGDSLLLVEGYNFNGCPLLSEVVFSKNLDEIDANCFADCGSLTEAGIVTNGNTNIWFDKGAFVFKTCLMSALGFAETDYVMDSGITSVSQGAFKGNATLRSIELSGNLQIICYEAFLDCTSLESVSFNSSLLILDENAFYGCTALKAVALPPSLRMVGETAFYGCTSLECVYIDDEVSSIGVGAFACCPSLKDFIVDEFNDTFSSADGILCAKLGKTGQVLLQYPQGRVVEGGILDLTKIDGLVSISSYAFSFIYADGLVPFTKIILPEGLQELEYGAFEDCYCLEEISVPGSVGVIEFSVFENCTNLRAITLKEGILALYYCFYGCASLESVSLPKTLAEITDSCFEGCTSLKELTLPDNAVVVGPHAFFRCTNLVQVTVTNTGTVFEDLSLEIVDEGSTSKILKVTAPQGYSIPAAAFGEHTEHSVELESGLPYPYENWIVIVIIVLMMVGLLRFIRRV